MINGRAGQSGRRSRVKICRVQSRICVGGPAHQALLLSTRLDPARYETVLIGGGLEPGEKDLLPSIRDAGVRAYHLPEMRRALHPVMDLRAFDRLCRIFRAEKPDIVHTHTAKAGAIGRLAARACGVPLVVHTFHGHVLRGYFPRPVEAAFRLMERALAGLTDSIVVISESQRQELHEEQRIAPWGKFRLVPLGLELKRFENPVANRGLLRRELGLASDVPLIGWVGRLTEVKDPSLFLRACARLEGFGQPHFLVVGDGHLRPCLEREARDLNIAERTHFLGYRQDTERIFADLSLFVLTSRNEGTPVAAIEAMASGLPIVATNVGGVADTLRGYPLATLTRPGDPVALADGMKGSLHGGRADGRSTLRRFGAERLVADVEALYEELLSRTGPAETSEDTPRVQRHQKVAHRENTDILEFVGPGSRVDAEAAIDLQSRLRG